MATGIIQAAVSHVKSKDCSNLGFAKSVDFVKTSNIMKFKSSKTKFLVIKSSNQVPDIAELQPASEGGSLLGRLVIILCFKTDRTNNVPEGIVDSVLCLHLMLFMAVGLRFNSNGCLVRNYNQVHWCPLMVGRTWNSIPGGGKWKDRDPFLS